MNTPDQLQNSMMMWDLASPHVSVVIPTLNRPEVALRAIQSALNQTFSSLEVVVVIDGPDGLSENALRIVDDPRFRLFPLPQNVGGAEARNFGVRSAIGKWIAFLDDDDEWLPEKLEKQLEAANRVRDPRQLVACRYLEKSSSGCKVEPEVLPQVGEALSEYLFCRVPIFGIRKGFIQTSTWLVPRQLLLDVPFTAGLKKDQDTDWILRAFPSDKGVIQILPETLSVFYNEPSTNRVSRLSDWKISRDWAISNRQLFTKKALSFYLVSSCMPALIKQGASLSSLSSLLGDCFRFGKVTPLLLWVFIRNVLFFSIASKLFRPQTQRKLRLAFSRLKLR